MSDAVTIIIDAEDKASAKFTEVNAKIDATAGKIRTTATATKKSADVAASFASAFGGSELGGFASQLGGITEKIGSFSEMAKNGGASSFAFKAGLSAVVAVAAFEVGKAIGNAVFEVDKWNKKLEESRARFKEIGEETSKLQDVRFNQEVEDIELIKDPAKKQAEYQAMLDVVNKEIIAIEAQTIKSRQATEAWQAAWQITGERKAEAKIAQDLYESDQARLKAARERRQQLEMITSEETRQRQLKKEQIEAEEEAEKARQATAKSEEATIQRLRDQLALEQAIGEEKFAVQASQMATDPARQAEIQSLLEQQDALQKQREAEKAAEEEKKKAAKDEEMRTQKILDLRDAELQKLKEREIALTKGAEAAESFKLEQQGLDKADADFIAQEQARIAKLEQDKDAEKQRQEKIAEASKQTPQPLQAVESRFLRVAPGTSDPTKATAENTKRMADRLDRLIAIQEAAGNGENADRLRKTRSELELIA